MLGAKIKNLLNFLSNKNILITTHHLADIDGITSSFTLKHFLNNYGERVNSHIVFSKLSQNSRKYIKSFNRKFLNFQLEFEKNSDWEKKDINTIIVVDTNNLDQVLLEDFLDLKTDEIPIIFLDHHRELEKSYPNNQSEYNIINDEISSTAEIILEFYRTIQVSLPLPVRFMLLSGILTDSSFFKHGNNKTVQNVSLLLNSDLKYQEVKIFLKTEEDISVKIAKIKGLQRTELIRYKNWLIGTSHVSSFESVVAGVLIKVGCDVGIVLSSKKDSTRISTRASRKICKKTGLHLGKLLEEIAQEINGSGGGHNGAAAINYDSAEKNIVEKIVNKVKNIID